MKVLLVHPFEFVALNELVDAVSITWPVQTWYRGLVRDVPPEKLHHLRELTRRPIEMDALLALPDNTFGHRFARFLRESQIAMGGHEASVSGLSETFETDWVTHRFFKIHDILHALCGFGVDVPGEMGLQMFDVANLREPYGAFSIAATPYMMLRYGKPVRMVREIIRGYRLAGKAQNLFFAPLEEMFEMDFEEVRVLVGLAERGQHAQATP